MLLIGITGQARSGKGEVAGFIKDWAATQGVTAKERGFSDLLKWSAYRLFKPDCTMDEGIEWSDSLKQVGRVGVQGAGRYFDPVNGREFLQRYGTEAHRDVFGEDFWLDQLLPLSVSVDHLYSDRLRSNFSNARIGIIADLRFDNEAERIRELGGAVWKVERHLEQYDAHSSEEGIDPNLIDCYLDNSEGLAELRLQVESEISNLMEDYKMQLRMQI